MIIGIRTNLFLKKDTIYRGVGILTWKNIKVKSFAEVNKLFSGLFKTSVVCCVLPNRKEY